MSNQPAKEEKKICKSKGCDEFAEEDVDYCASHQPYLRNTPIKESESVGKIRIS